MSRLLAAIRLDLLLQWRYGFCYAAAFITLVWIAALSQVPAFALRPALVLIIFMDLAVVGFYFIAGMVLFEKDEGTLFALVVTPLRFREYLAAKLATLTLLALAISLVVVAATLGAGFDLPLLVLGVVLTSLLVLLVGLIAVAPYSSISEYIIPSQLYLLPLGLPVFHYVGWIDHPVFYLIPTQGSLLLLHGAFAPIAPWQAAYATIYQLIWVGLLVLLARRRFERHVVAREGGR